jgi:BASS family bile acid:Na+ symporter
VFFMLILPLTLGILTNVRLSDFAGTDPQDHAENFCRWRSSCRFHRRWRWLRIGVSCSLYALTVAGLVVLHNALALSSGYLSATVMRLSDYDRRSITIETGIQNSGLGLVLIFAFFGGLGGMAVSAASVGHLACDLRSCTGHGLVAQRGSPMSRVLVTGAAGAVGQVLHPGAGGCRCGDAGY